MAAQPELFSPHPGTPAGRPETEARPPAIVLPLRRTDAQGRKLVDQTSGDRLGPAGGLLMGLGLGAILWLGLGLLAWEFFRH